MENWKPSKRYMHQLGALYGQNKPMAPPPKRMVSAMPCEYDEQVRFVNWLDDMGIISYAVPNGRANATAGEKYRRSGAVAGVPDVVIPYARKGYHGLYTELKVVSGGVVSPEQRYWIEFLNDQGYLACVCRGFDHAKQVVEDYFREE